MSYTPKSKYQILKSSGDQYQDPRTGNPYVGPYILTSEGAFIGNDISNRGQRLIKFNSGNLTKNNNIYFHKNTKEYNKANKSVNLNTIGNFKSIVASKTLPSDKDYQIGHYTRYFCKRNNVNNLYYEIDKKTFKSLVSKKEYDYVLYTPGYLNWAIDGNIIKTNSNILKQKERDFPNISKLFTKLNEFQKIRKTEGGELRYLDGKEYVGYYHIHLQKPMVGLYHTSTSHKTLEYINITNKQQSPSFFSSQQSTGYTAPENIQSQISTPNIPSSGGGGGGY